MRRALLSFSLEVQLTQDMFCFCYSALAFFFLFNLLMLIKVGKKKGITLSHYRIWTEGKWNKIDMGRGGSAIRKKTSVGLILLDNLFCVCVKTTKNKSYFQV